MSGSDSAPSPEERFRARERVSFETDLRARAYVGEGISVESLEREIREDREQQAKAELGERELRVGGLVVIEADGIDEIHVDAMKAYQATGDVEFLAMLSMTTEELEQMNENVDALERELDRELAREPDQLTEIEVLAIEHEAPSDVDDARVRSLLQESGAQLADGLLNVPETKPATSEEVALTAISGAGAGGRRVYTLEEILTELEGE